MNRVLRSTVTFGLLALPALVAAQPAAPAPAAPPPAAPAPAAPAPAAPAAATPAPAPAAETPAATPPAAPAAETAPTPAPEPFATPVPAVPASAPSEPAQPAEQPTPPPQKLGVGSEGLFQPGALIQAWLLIERAKGASETTVTFRLRRAEMSMKGEIIPKQFGYGIMADFAKVLEPQDASLPVNDAMGDATGDTVTAKQPPKGTALSALQDAYVTYMTEYVDASIGQYKIPVSYEGFNGSSKLAFAERGATAREFGDRRDLGLKLAKTFEYVGYTVGLFNGTGLNTLDDNDGKDGALRLEVYPVEGLTIAGVAYASLWDRKDAGSKDRWEGDVHFDKYHVLVNVELIAARDRKASGDVHGLGVSGLVGYSLLDDQLQPVVRVDYLDPDTDANVDPTTNKDGKDELVRVDVGVNYYVRKNELKLQLDYSRFEYEDKAPNNQVIFATQLSF